jgi:hypothetical protein
MGTTSVLGFSAIATFYGKGKPKIHLPTDKIYFPSDSWITYNIYIHMCKKVFLAKCLP